MPRYQYGQVGATDQEAIRMETPLDLEINQDWKSSSGCFSLLFFCFFSFLDVQPTMFLFPSALGLHHN